ncbi:unnamed protein product [Peronospora belbahrii]|uniref:Uncharacterized protein n=1 Tax=Peronospora belbahrii TaxID=622444 RepID=A0AAU9L626_9STRA|nr:unnamed protein product [Peronospora belbahrii]
MPFCGLGMPVANITTRRKDQLTVLLLADVEEREDVLRARQRTNARRGNLLFGRANFARKHRFLPDRPSELNRRSVHAVRATQEGSSSEVSSLGSSDSDGDLRYGDGERPRVKDPEGPNIQRG